MKEEIKYDISAGLRPVALSKDRGHVLGVRLWRISAQSASYHRHQDNGRLLVVLAMPLILLFSPANLHTHILLSGADLNTIIETKQQIDLRQHSRSWLALRDLETFVSRRQETTHE